jgi:hypothetical protein
MWQRAEGELLFSPTESQFKVFHVESTAGELLKSQSKFINNGNTIL